MRMMLEHGSPEPFLISIIVPTLNEGRSIGATLAAIAPARDQVEVIVVDGGSVDETVEIAGKFGAQVIACKRGRGLQMHAGASAARGWALWFLHADTIIPPDGIAQIRKALARDSETVGGNFTIRFDGEGGAARFLTWLYPQLRRLGLCYGDSAIFVRASVYREIGGFKPLPLFEDLDLVRRLKARGRIAHLRSAVVTSSRRFEGQSFALTFIRWAILQALYWAGVNPHLLSRLYAPVRRE
jgi:rSAM/selenodomain-associated transferase 2